MIVPSVTGLSSALSESLTNNVHAPQAAGNLAQGVQSGNGLGGAGLQGGGGLEGSGALQGGGGVERAGGVEATGGGEGVNFGSELTNAISSLEGTQTSADSAAQALASGTTTDPESAVVTVEDAQMAMDLASQIRTKATEAAQSIFQTQV